MPKGKERGDQMVETPTRVQRFFRRLQDQPFVAVVLIVSLIVIGVGTFTDAIDKLVQFSKKYVYTSSPQSKRATSDAPIPKPTVPIASETRPVDSKQLLPKEQPKRESELSKEVPPDVDGKLAATLKTVPSAREIREVVSAAASALRGETTSDRVRSVAALMSNLPEDLNAREIALLAGNETTSHREQILELLVKRTRPRSLDPEDIPAVLGTETTANRVECILIIAQYIRPPITGKQAAAILGSETDSHRVACLRPIAPLLRRPLSESEVESILRGTSTSDRTEAIKALFDQAKVRE